MIQVRKALFETNSSSTHAIVVPKRELDSEDYDLYCSWEDYGLEFGRQTYRMLDNWDLKLAYIYQVLLSADGSMLTPDLDKFKEQINEIYSDLTKKSNHKFSMSYEVTPDQIFLVLDFLHKKDLGLIPDDQKLGVDVPTKFGDLLSGDSYCFVDHTEYFFEYSDDDRREDKPCADFIKRLLNDEEYLKKFIFGKDSYITIGGDEYRGYNLKTVGFEEDYDDYHDWDKKVKEYEEDYDVYFKGN